MAASAFNIAKGKAVRYAMLPETNDALIVLLLKASGLESHAVLKDYDDVAAILAAANDECDFTNYGRKTITSVTVTVDDTNDRTEVDFADQSWPGAGGATNNSIGMALVAYDPDTTGGTDSALIPLSMHDFVVTTSGGTLNLQVAASGAYRAS